MLRAPSAWSYQDTPYFAAMLRAFASSASQLRRLATRFLAGLVALAVGGAASGAAAAGAGCAAGSAGEACASLKAAESVAWAAVWQMRAIAAISRIVRIREISPWESPET